MSLTPRQAKFVQEYLIDQNGTRSAIAAGYSTKSAAEASVQLLRNIKVKTEIKKGLDAQLGKIKKREAKVIFTKEMWLRELKLIAMTNIDDFVTIDEYQSHIEHDEKTGKDRRVMALTTKAIPTKKRRHKSLGRAIKKISETKNGIAIELHGKQAALDTLGKHYGWVKDGVVVDDPSKPRVVLTMPINGREAPKETVKTEETDSDE